MHNGRFLSSLRRHGVTTIAALAVAVLTVTLGGGPPAHAASVTTTSAREASTTIAPVRTAALPSSITDGGNIISDAEFFASTSMSSKQIQSFLDGKVAACRATTGPDCLKSYRATVTAKPADRYCGAITGGTKVLASEIIHRVARACAINPKVLLVMLQKEQGLITSTAPSNWNIQQAMGQACPDFAACDPKFAGFFNQVYGGARQLQKYTQHPESWRYQAGQVNTIQWSPDASCGTSRVYIANQATANLYIYTPYRPNVAALAAGYGTGDACSTYGNRNFYNYYVSWFSPNSSSSKGAPAQIAACSVPKGDDIVARSGSMTVSSRTTGRTAPTTLCGTGSRTLAEGTTLTVTGRYGAWTRATVGGASLWIANAALSSPGVADACKQPASSSIAAASGTAVVTLSSGRLNARLAPSTSCTTDVRTLSNGTTVPHTGTSGAWWRISLEGKTYWVHGDYMRKQAPTGTVKPSPKPSAAPSPKPKPPVTAPAPAPRPPAASAPMRSKTTTALNLRTSPSTSSRVIRVLPKSAVVTINDNRGVWRKVTAGSSTGWVHSSYLTPTSKVMKTTAALNLRTAPSTSAKVAVVIPKSKNVRVIANQGTWRKVTYGSRTGWVSASYLR